MKPLAEKGRGEATVLPRPAVCLRPPRCGGRSGFPGTRCVIEGGWAGVRAGTGVLRGVGDVGGDGERYKQLPVAAVPEGLQATPGG